MHNSFNPLPLIEAALLLAGCSASLHAGNVVTFENQSKSVWTLTTVTNPPADDKGRVKFTELDAKMNPVSPSQVKILGSASDNFKPDQISPSIDLKANTTYSVEYSRDLKQINHLFTLTSKDPDNPTNSVTFSTISTMGDALLSGFGPTPPPRLFIEKWVPVDKSKDKEMKDDEIINHFIYIGRFNPGGLTILGSNRDDYEAKAYIVNPSKNSIYIYSPKDSSNVGTIHAIKNDGDETITELQKLDSYPITEAKFEIKSGAAFHLFYRRGLDGFKRSLCISGVNDNYKYDILYDLYSRKDRFGDAGFGFNQGTFGAFPAYLDPKSNPLRAIWVKATN